MSEFGRKFPVGIAKPCIRLRISGEVELPFSMEADPGPSRQGLSGGKRKECGRRHQSTIEAASKTHDMRRRRAAVGGRRHGGGNAPMSTRAGDEASGGTRAR